jgi:hypothetical protein
MARLIHLIARRRGEGDDKCVNLLTQTPLVQTAGGVQLPQASVPLQPSGCAPHCCVHDARGVHGFWGSIHAVPSNVHTDPGLHVPQVMLVKPSQLSTNVPHTRPAQTTAASMRHGVV